jgi:hypothetical protein
MPLTGNKCPGKDQLNPFSEGFCLTGCRNTCMPLSVLVQIEHRATTDKHRGRYISATSLLNCIRKTYGERVIDYYVEPPNSWYSVRGTLLHNILQNPGFASQVEDLRETVYRLFRNGIINKDELERQWVALEAQLFEFSKHMPKSPIDDWESEVEYEYPLGIYNGEHWFLRGTIDVLRRVAGQILDYKTMGDKGLGIIKDGTKKEHEWQFNIYRFMVERGYPVGMSYNTYSPVEIKQIRAFYMTMMEVVGTGTNWDVITGWQKSEPFDHPSMVGKEFLEEKTEIVCKRGKRKNSTNPDDFEPSLKRKWKLTYAIPEVKLYDLDDVEKFIQEKAVHLIDAFSLGVMPPMAEPATREWLCNFCPNEIKGWCDEQNAKDGVERIVAVEEDIPVEA